ncbi:hypothetical protein [Agromyces sp. SYSU T00194]|uniref:hypothetical protein n=1 Tax=Agromyces chitinivorans TaxID=3158560 RepID=UPI003398B6A5
MTAATHEVRLGGALRRAAVLTWSELPAACLAAAIVAAAWVPLVVAVATGATALVPATVALAAVGASAMSSVAGSMARGEPLRVRMLRRIDPVWVAVATIVGATMFGVAVAGGAAGQVFAAVLGAIAGLVLPLAAAYGGLRERRGLSALRGGAVIALVRPSAALCVLAVGVLAAFAVVASAGVLVLVLAPVHALYTALLAADVVALVNDEADA